MKPVMFWSLIVLASTWGILLLAVALADAIAHRRHRELLEVRDWQETVQAMRRMQDREGDA